MGNVIEVVKSAWSFEAVFRDAGFTLVRGKAPCPFHEDKTPSFSVKGERGRCWAGCFNGDVIDFTAKYHGLNFQDALKLLADRAGIRRQTSTEARAAQREREKRQELLRAFMAWEQKMVNDISAVLRAYRRLMVTRTDYTETELIILAGLQGQIDYLDACYEVFCSKDDEAKYELYKEDQGYDTAV